MRHVLNLNNDNWSKDLAPPTHEKTSLRKHPTRHSSNVKGKTLQVHIQNDESPAERPCEAFGALAANKTTSQTTSTSDLPRNGLGGAGGEVAEEDLFITSSSSGIRQS